MFSLISSEDKIVWWKMQLWKTSKSVHVSPCQSINGFFYSAANQIRLIGGICPSDLLVDWRGIIVDCKNYCFLLKINLLHKLSEVITLCNLIG